MDTRALAHRWFHEPDKNGEYRNLNVHYKHRYNEDYSSFYSYSTEIGRRMFYECGEIFICTSVGYSNTTIKHISNIQGAYPGDGTDKIVVTVGIEDLPIYSIVEKMINMLSYMNVDNMSVKRCRDSFMRTYISISKILNNKMIVNDSGNIMTSISHEKADSFLDRLSKFNDMVEYIHDINISRANGKKSEKEMERARKVAEAKREIAKSEKAVVEKLVDKYGEFECYSVLDSRRYATIDVTNDEACILRKHLNSGYDSVYMSNEGVFATTKGVKVNIDEMRRLVSLYMNGKVLGEKVNGIYNVVKMDEKSVKIGCHLISKKNIELIIKYLEQ